MVSEPARIRPIVWFSAIPAFVAIPMMVVVDFVFHTSFAFFGFLGLLVLGMTPPLAFTEVAAAELERGFAAGRFVERFLWWAGSFIAPLIGVALFAFLLAVPPSPYVWILLQVLGTGPATVTAIVLMIRSMRLPRHPYSGPLFVVKWR